MPPPTNQQIQTHRSTDPNPPSTNPLNPPIQTQPADPRQSKIQNLKPNSGASFEQEKCEKESEKGEAMRDKERK